MLTHLRIVGSDFCAKMAKLTTCDRDHWLAKMKIFTLWYFTEKVRSPLLYAVKIIHVKVLLIVKCSVVMWEVPAWNSN